MKIERKTHTSREISTSSLPDIIFMLLIFFMVTTVMREYEGLDVIIPRAKMIEKLESKRHTTYMPMSCRKGRRKTPIKSRRHYLENKLGLNWG